MTETFEQIRSGLVRVVAGYCIVVSLVALVAITFFVAPLLRSQYVDADLSLPFVTRLALTPAFTGIGYFVVALSFIPGLILRGRQASLSVVLSVILLLFFVGFSLSALLLPMMK